MTSSDGSIFRVTGHLCGNSTVTRESPAQRPVTRSFDDFFDQRLNKWLCKQWWDWWFDTTSHPLWRHCNGKHDHWPYVWCAYIFKNPSLMTLYWPKPIPKQIVKIIIPWNILDTSPQLFQTYTLYGPFCLPKNTSFWKKSICLTRSQNHGCWCSGIGMSQGISSHDVDLVCLQ